MKKYIILSAICWFTAMQLTADEGANDTPTRVEKNSFSNVSEIAFRHQYGNIIIRESNSKQVTLETQYFDSGNEKLSSNATMNNKILTITSSNTAKENSKAKINYIIDIPRNTTLTINLKYGDVRVDKFEGTLSAELSYGEIFAPDLANTKLKMNLKYSYVKIGEVGSAVIDASYSDIQIKKAGNIEIFGSYNDTDIDEVKTLSFKKSVLYGDYRIGSVGNMDGVAVYSDVIIDNLLSSMNFSSTYGDITVKSTSPNLKNINFKGSYADISIGIPTALTASFDLSLNYGDLNIDKKHTAKYTLSDETTSKTLKKGQIGKGNPTATIVVSNSYSDVYIK